MIAIGLAGCKTAPAPKPLPLPKDPPPQDVPGLEPISKIGNHSPYRVLGKTYRVLPTSVGYSETGIASWYGKKFHGRPTSNMETFDMYKLTAAHKSLPLPTYVRVTNLQNNLSVVVRVNDRGPFKDDRIIDLSYAAAKEIQMVQQGTALVQVDAIGPEGEQPRDPVDTARHVYLQLGVFSERDNAVALLARLRGSEFPPTQIQSLTDQQQTFHKVRMGPLIDADHADTLTARLALLGLERPKIVFE